MSELRVVLEFMHPSGPRGIAASPPLKIASGSTKLVGPWLTFDLASSFMSPSETGEDCHILPD